MTLISAPAGSGKTTLLTEWIGSSGRGHASAGWLSLDESDNEPTTFWTYVIAALRTAAPEVGAGALDSLDEGQQPLPEAALTLLINDLDALPGPITLVLDDYHVIHSPEVQAGVLFFVDHLPENVNLMIATRSDPALPLARMRSRRELIEVRASDLRFTSDEAGAYLSEMGLALTRRELAVLEERTEGWIAALQLAALSLQSREDVASFIDGFAGSDRYIVDYLVEEVLQALPDEVRSFLLQTSILDRMNGPLCDAVTDRTGGKTMLERLDRANLFTVPLDDHRQWYRYHHLVAHVLHARLLDEQTGLELVLHRRASAWWERNGQQAEAIRHAFAGEDFGRAADLVELALPDLSRRRQEHTMREWLDAIPDELFETRPVLAIGYVGSRLVSGDLEGVEIRLRQAEQWVNGSGAEFGHNPDEMVVRDDEAFRRLPRRIAVY
ncbi:MAG TPA: helix-turn-helix transcriptional regulator, partial [Thermoanaerobaculia bacterium]|nr:helix-turn-helix transcriptional regulator [Thermoanaerobaculia bacterium]